MIRGLRVATYNVHKCRGMDWRVSTSRVLNVIREMDADIFSLQEVFCKQANFISERLEIPVAFGAARKLAGDDYGNAVFSRFGFLQTCNYDLSVRSREPRRCLRADIQIDQARAMHLFAVHLGTSFFERRQQAGRLVSDEILKNAGLNGPRMVIGDFNEWTRGLISRTLSLHMQSADLVEHLQRRRTYPGVIPFLHLDHIYYDAPLKLAKMHLHRTRASLVASDHLPLIGEFEWPVDECNP